MSKFQVVTRRKSSRKSNSETRRPPLGDERLQSAKDIKAVEWLSAHICREFTNAIVDAARNNYKYCYVFKYNDDPDRGELSNDSILGVDTKRILSGEWIPTAQKYFERERCKSIRRRLEEYIKQKPFNGGVDEETGHPYTVTVFYRKKEPSVFSNGVIVGRAGLTYK